MNYKYATIGTMQRIRGNFIKNLPAAFFDEKLAQFISNPDDIPQGMKAGFFVYNPDDQFTRFITEKELNEALALKNNPVGHLQEASNLFRQEGLEKKDRDEKASKAAFEDAALVLNTIECIENGLHRGEYSDDALKKVEAGK